MDHFALLPAAERATIFREATAGLKLGTATIVEKDFWVCWTPQRIFSRATLPGPLFKGGTDLGRFKAFVMLLWFERSLLTIVKLGYLVVSVLGLRTKAVTWGRCAIRGLVGS